MKMTLRTLPFLLLALPAAADEVVLRNGAVFHGSVSEEGGRVMIRTDAGSMTFKRIDVREIRRTGDPLKELEKKAAGATTAKEYYELALSARERGFSIRSGELLEKVILLEPGHEGARLALGYEKHEGRWFRGDDLKEARGFVKHNGSWIQAELLDRELARQAEERLERERIRAAERQSNKDFEIEMQRIALERERLELEKKRRRADDWAYPYVSPGCGPFIVPPMLPRTNPAGFGTGGLPSNRPSPLRPWQSSLVPSVPPFTLVPRP